MLTNSVCFVLLICFVLQNYQPRTQRVEGNYFIDQKVHLDFSVTSYGKTQT